MRTKGSVSLVRGRWRVRALVDGERTSLGTYDTETEAREVLASAIGQMRAEHDASALSRWGAAWLDDREIDPSCRAVDKQRRLWRARIDTAPFAAWPLDAIDAPAIRQWVHASLREPARRVVREAGGGSREVETGRTLGRQTVVNALNLLRVCLEAAIDAGKLRGTNPARGIRVPKIARAEDPWTWLTADEIGIVLAADPHPAIVVAIFAGLRKGELWGLRWCDVRLTADVPHLRVARSYRGPTKGGREREVPLLAPAVDALRRWLAERPGVASALVFPSDAPKDPKSRRAAGGPHDESYDAGWSRLRRRAGIARPVRFHDLRHTCASHLLQGTWAPHWTVGAARLEDVQLWLGHRSRSTTERYAHLAPDGLRGLVASGRSPINLGTRSRTRPAES